VKHTTSAARRLARYVSRFPRRRIAVLGDLMLDDFLWGRVSRISPEAPVPVVDITDHTASLGGAGNVVANIRSLGGQPVPFGVIGKDAAGERLCALLRKMELSTGGLVSVAGRHTTVKTRIIEVSRKHQVVRADRETRTPIERDVIRRLVRRLLSQAGRLHGLIISDYDKGVVVPELLAELLPALEAAKVPVFLDPRTRHPLSYQPITVITPNQREAEIIAGIEIGGQQALCQAGERILEMLGCRWVLITLGERGMALFERGRPMRAIATTAREVYDVTGAGDTVIAALALAFCSQASMLEAAAVANYAAGIAVAHVGTVAPTAHELRAALLE
jgi:D-beta-D-heptose 7-phosphate kinase/D-beta-D-heptose 1-phosphate adenosyltransferase